MTGRYSRVYIYTRVSIYVYVYGRLIIFKYETDFHHSVKIRARVYSSVTHRFVEITRNEKRVKCQRTFHIRYEQRAKQRIPENVRRTKKNEFGPCRYSSAFAKCSIGGMFYAVFLHARFLTPDVLKIVPSVARRNLNAGGALRNVWLTNARTSHGYAVLNEPVVARPV